MRAVRGASVADRRQAKSPYTEDRLPPGLCEGRPVGRRRFRVGSVHLAGAAAAAAFTLPAVGFALGPIFHRSRISWQDVGPLSDFPDTAYVPRVITLTPDIGEVGKSTVYVRRNNPAIDGKPKDQYDNYVAISTKCMHLGCPVRYIEASQRFVCPCHGRVYDFQGKRPGGPPVRPLARFYTRAVAPPLQLRPRFSVHSQLRRV